QMVPQRLYELIFGLESEAGAILDFIAEEEARALEELEGVVGGPVDLETVGPFVGRYANPDLGAIELRIEEGELVLDAGSFASRLRTVLEDGEVDGYVTYDVPFAGLVLEFEEDDQGMPSIRIGEGAVAYTFRVDS